jgi:aminoglycoside phosphotransferase (APT) family kinase protein
MAYQPDRRREQAAAYLSAKLGRPVAVTALARLSTGHSRETLMVATDLPDRPDFVFRIEQGGVLGTSSEPEFRLLQALYGGPVPVPRPLWLEDDPQWFGFPFMVTERVDGYGGIDYLQDPIEKVKVLQEYVQTIAQMHSYSPEELGLGHLGIPRDTREATLRQIEYWADIYRRYRFVHEPIVDEAILWLKRNVPDPQRPVALIHGDLSFGNFILRDDRVVAHIDWEWSNLGDPMEDVAFFAYVKGRAFAPPEETIELFRQYSKFRWTDAELRYWEVFNYVKCAAANIATLKVFCEGRNYGLNMVAIGTGGFLGFTARLAEALRRRAP